MQPKMCSRAPFALFTAGSLPRRYGGSARAHFIRVVQNGIDAVSSTDHARGGAPTALLLQQQQQQQQPHVHWHVDSGRPEKRQRTGGEGRDASIRANGIPQDSSPNGVASTTGGSAAVQLASYLKLQVACCCSADCDMMCTRRIHGNELRDHEEPTKILMADGRSMWRS